MAKKKIIIYSIIAVVFGTLFSLYIWLSLGSTNSANEQRLKENMRITEQQMQENLQARAMDLAMEITKDGLSSLTGLQALIAKVDGYADLNSEYYVVDGQGVLHSGVHQLKGARLEANALKTAQDSGYAAVGLPSAQGAGVGLIVPIGDNSPYYLARVMTTESFFSILASNLPIRADMLLLFDEWGGLLGVYGDNGDAELQQRMQVDAGGYSNDGQKQAYCKAGNDGSYNVYLTVDQPHGWFVGTQVCYREAGTTILGLHVSSLVMLAALVSLLISMVCLDVFNDREKKRESEHVGAADILTGLHTGIGMQGAMEALTAKQSVKGYSLVCMDIVAFSRINTMFGHMIGDSVLRAIGHVIQEHTLCGSRINADRFAFLTKTQPNIVEQFEEHINHAIALQLGSEYLQMMSYKFGIYHIHEAHPVIREVYEGALLALKDAKKQALQNAITYDESLRKTTEIQRSIEVNMMHALSKEEFVVYIQPQFDLPGEACNRGETLIRWNSEFMGFMPPDQFIPVFERNGFVVETDFFMLVSALELQQQRLREGKRPLTIAVNQSKVTIAFPNYFERLKATAADYDVPLSSIELEITESTLENAWETIVPLIHSIKKLGFSVAMDDFGSGYSSLNTLRILPIDVLKIDKAFLQEADSSLRCRTIIKNVINMAKELSIQVVCEGVETKVQLEFLKDIGCDIAQGYYYSRPIPLKDFVEKYVKD